MHPPLPCNFDERGKKVSASSELQIDVLRKSESKRQFSIQDLSEADEVEVYTVTELIS